VFSKGIYQERRVRREYGIKAGKNRTNTVQASGIKRGSVSSWNELKLRGSYAMPDCSAVHQQHLFIAQPTTEVVGFVNALLHPYDLR
jgi:hypothetical protein